MAFFQILIPNYNSAKWIEKGLRSILDQTYQDFIIHVADDLSIDISREIIQKLSDEFPGKITLNILPEKSGYPGGTRNYLIDKYKTPDTTYTLFMDSDDWFHDENCLKRIHDTAVEACKNDIWPDLIRLAFIIYESEYKQTYVDLKELTIKDVTVSPFIAPWTKAVKTEKLVKFPVNSLFEDIPQHLAQCDILESSCWVQDPTIVWNRQKENTVSLTANLNTEANKKKLLISRFQMMADLYRLELTHEYSNAMRDSWLNVGKDWLKSEKLV